MQQIRANPLKCRQKGIALQQEQGYTKTCVRTKKDQPTCPYTPPSAGRYWLQHYWLHIYQLFRRVSKVGVGQPVRL